MFIIWLCSVSAVRTMSAGRDHSPSKLGRSVVYWADSDWKQEAKCCSWVYV